MNAEPLKLHLVTITHEGYETGHLVEVNPTPAARGEGPAIHTVTSVKPDPLFQNGLAERLAEADMATLEFRVDGVKFPVALDTDALQLTVSPEQFQAMAAALAPKPKAKRAKAQDTAGDAGESAQETPPKRRARRGSRPH